MARRKSTATTTTRGRPTQYLERFGAALRLEQYAVLEYYAATNRRDKVDILRHILRTFALLDRNLDDKAFAKFVRDELEPRCKDDPDKLDTLRTRVKDFLEERAEIHKKK